MDDEQELEQRPCPSSSGTPRMELGRRSEALVAEQLVAGGFHLLARNVRVGRLEIDLIARRATTIVVCEVRSRRRLDRGHPAETVDAKKQERIRRAAISWLRDQQVAFRELRFDVAAVIHDQQPPRIDYYADAF